MFPKMLWFLALMIPAPLLGADEAPPWLKQAASAKLSEYDKKVSYVVLTDESRVALGEDGKLTRASTYAIKILIKEGRDSARAEAIYRPDSDKVRELRCWLIQPTGEVKKYEKKETVDIALATNDVYNEVRKKVISARDDAVAGSIFGYESITEERSVFTQFEWFFQSHEPVVLSRLVLTLPPSWSAESATFNHAPIKPQSSGSSYTWELRDLPYIESEPMSPSLMNIVPRLAISFHPPAGASTASRSFKSWVDVSRWLSELSDPQAAVTDAIANKAAELIAGKSSEWEKIDAIARFTQSINYVSIQTGVGRGGGYRPHTASEVFAKSYGDCKDKANLMRALLKAIGVTSYPVSVYSRDRYYVREEWPTPQQFNHCIIAIKIGDQTKASPVINHEKLGRLLIFDPTDDNTILGDLPRPEQGSFALIVAGDAGGLLRLPASAPEANKVERKFEVELQADGSIRAQGREETSGQASSEARSQIRGLNKESYTKMIERWISRTVRGAKVTQIEPHDDQAGGRSTLDIAFSAERYGQSMQNRLLVFNPTIVSRREWSDLSEPTRKLPVVIESQAFEESVNIKLPAGYAVDEVPEAVKLEGPFGEYKAACTMKEGLLHYSRSLVLRDAVFPPDQYGGLRKFFDAIRTSEQTPAVLVRK